MSTSTFSNINSGDLDDPQLKEFGYAHNIKSKSLPKNIIVEENEIINANTNNNAIDDSTAILENLLDKLRPFQRVAFDFATRENDQEKEKDKTRNPYLSKKEKPKSNPKNTNKSGKGTGRLLLADEMGLGKTVTSLAIMTYYKSEWPLLILCPASLRHTWPSEIEKFLPALPPSATYVVSGFDDVDFVSKVHTITDNGKIQESQQQKKIYKTSTVQIVIASYSLLQTRSASARALQQVDFQCIIVDESHNLKEKSSQRFQLAQPLLKNARRLIMLSGTPALARPVELWTQIHCINSSLLGSYTSFTKQHCNAKRDPRFGYWDVSGSSNRDELNAKLKTIMIRRLKSDVLSELPSKQRSIVPVQIDSEHLSQCRDLMKQMNDMKLSNGFTDPTLWGTDLAKKAHFEAKCMLMQAYQSCGIGKAKAVSEYVLDWLRGSGTGQKVLVFAHHTQVLDTVENVICKAFGKGLGHIRIDGSVPSAERAILVRKFQTKAHIRVALLSVTAAGVGLTLTAASNVIFSELHWTPGVLAQAEDRCHRIGQHNAVNITYCVCENEDVSIDMALWKMLGRKIGTLGNIIDGKKGVSMDANKIDLHDEHSKTEKKGNGISSEEELSSFFANNCPTNQSPNQNQPVKGSIQSFFNKIKFSSAKSKSQKEPAISNKQMTHISSPPYNTIQQSTMTINAKKIPENSLKVLQTKGKSNIPITFTCTVCTFINENKFLPTSGKLCCEICGLTYSNENKKIHPINDYEVIDLTAKNNNLPDLCEMSDETHSLPTHKLLSNSYNGTNTANDDGETNRSSSNGSMKDITKKKYCEKVKEKKSNKFSFSISKNSGRVTIHEFETGKSLLVNFDIEQLLTDTCSDQLLEMRSKRISKVGGRRSQTSDPSSIIQFKDSAITDLVEVIIAKNFKGFLNLHTDQLYGEIKAFVSAYIPLREVEKKMLQEWGKPLTTYSIRKQLAQMFTTNSKNSMTERYVGGAKERAIENMTKTSLSSVHDSSRNEKDQAVINGHACAWCGESLPAVSLEKEVKSTYCSQKCAEEGRLRRGGMFASNRVRDQVFALERGVCQKCGIDAHALFIRINAMQPAERLNALVNANWKLPKSQASLEKLLHKPKEGDFWQADHIVPVAEGGGGCGLDNLQTLCSPCHKVETELLRARLRLMGGQTSPQDGKGQMDIREAFFGRKRVSESSCAMIRQKKRSRPEVFEVN